MFNKVQKISGPRCAFPRRDRCGKTVEIPTVRGERNRAASRNDCGCRRSLLALVAQHRKVVGDKSPLRSKLQDDWVAWRVVGNSYVTWDYGRVARDPPE